GCRPSAVGAAVRRELLRHGKEVLMRNNEKLGCIHSVKVLVRNDADESRFWNFAGKRDEFFQGIGTCSKRRLIARRRVSLVYGNVGVGYIPYSEKRSR